MVDTIGFSMNTIMSSVNKESFSYSFLTRMPFISFSYLITTTRTSNTILNKSGESGHPCLFPDLRGNILIFASWVWCWLWVSLIWPLLFEVCSLDSYLAECFHHKWVLDFMKYFFSICWYDQWFLTFILFMWCIAFIDL